MGQFISISYLYLVYKTSRVGGTSYDDENRVRLFSKAKCTHIMETDFLELENQTK